MKEIKEIKNVLAAMSIQEKSAELYVEIVTIIIIVVFEVSMEFHQ